MTLVETLVAVAILVTALVVFMGGLSAGSLATTHGERMSTAHELARSQMETTKAEPYNAAPYGYPPVAAPAGYSVTADASAIAGGGPEIQLITVEVSRDGAVLYTLEGYKVDR